MAKRGRPVGTYRSGKLGGIRNPDGIWVNSQAFREEGNKFMKQGYYCPDPAMTPAWMDYWKEQRRRCIYGYSVGGVKITGDHYFYLNFCPMQKAEIVSGRIANKVEGFPDFWDGDFNYFWARQIARVGIFELEENIEKRDKLYDLKDEDKFKKLEKLYKGLNLVIDIPSPYLIGGYNMVVGKSRRRGFSYKSASIAANNYFTRPNSLTILGAEDKKYLYPGKGALFTMVNDSINFINSSTAWAMPSDVVYKVSAGHRKASYMETVNGISSERGFQSEVMSLTFADNPDAARGKSAHDVFFEEAGAFGTPGLLKQAYAATEDCVKAGVVKTGMITVWGTSGDMEGGTADYSEMFLNPTANDFLPIRNMWDEGMSDSFCGYFHPANLNLEGFYDKQGNSNLETAKEAILKEREDRVRGGTTSAGIQKMLAEKPLCPAEAFASASINNYPTVELNNQLIKVKTKGLQQIHGKPVELYREDGKVKSKMLLSGKVQPITSLRDIPENKEGCIVVYEQPVSDAPKGLYKIGYDPVRQDSGTSLASIIVYKSYHKYSMYHSTIVAEYVGRKEMSEDIDRIAELLADYYNTTIMYENEVTSVKNYFRRYKRLGLLAVQPDNVISKNIKKSKVSRVYGCHMNDQLKDAGERYIKDWLLTTLDFDEEGKAITVIDRIFSIRLLEELISYNRKGNFDLHSALIMCMIQVQEESLDTQYGSAKDVQENYQDLIDLKKSLFKR